MYASSNQIVYDLVAFQELLDQIKNYICSRENSITSLLEQSHAEKIHKEGDYDMSKAIAKRTLYFPMYEYWCCFTKAQFYFLQVGF